MNSSIFKVMLFCVMTLGMAACQNEEVQQTATVVNQEIKPIDIGSEGFDFLEKMQGHWIGQNKVLGWEWDWFGFDYRPISSSHIFGIYEGGTLGNLLTSFFVSDFKGTRTIMSRNGGVLNGIYRTSYFVLDQVRKKDGEDYYRLVDAIGGENTMYMELVFKQDSLYWNAYTSRLGENTMPTRHFSFRGAKKHLQLAKTAAMGLNFPQNVSAWDFSNGFQKEYLYALPEENTVKSASFLAQAGSNDVFTLANQSGDPFRIQDHPYLSQLKVDITKSSQIKDDNLFLYLSFEPLTDSNGYMLADAFDSVLQFPDIAASEDGFLFTYLHPGEYYVTVIADHNSDKLPGLGDITHRSQKINISPKSEHQISIGDITIQN
ncbi:MAG: hypothetical protein AB3N16_04700 [Flavobacteriaceae bacterium]